MENELSRLDKTIIQAENELKQILEKAQNKPENLVFSNEAIQNLFYQKIDLFEHQHLLKDQLKEIVYYYTNIDNGELTYNQCKEFQMIAESIGYTLDYGLDAVPINLRPMSKGDQVRLYQQLLIDSIRQPGERATDKEKDNINLQIPILWKNKRNLTKRSI